MKEVKKIIVCKSKDLLEEIKKEFASDQTYTNS